MAVKTTKEVEQELLSEREEILNQPKVKLTIPPNPLDPAKYREVFVNGQQFILAVGKPVEVPQVVADVWNESYTKTIEAQFAMEHFNEL
jgi:hypothetical protein